MAGEPSQRSEGEGPATSDSDSPGRLLTLARAAEVVPLSTKQLYRVARREDGPFFKVEGRWMVYESELHAWVRSHRPRRRATPETVDAMPLPRRRARRGSLRSRVIELETRK